MISMVQTTSLLLGISGIALMIKAIVNYKAYQRGVMTRKQLVTDYMFTLVFASVILIGVSMLIKSTLHAGQ